MNGAIRILRNSLKKRCSVDINNIDALASAVEAYQARIVPALSPDLLLPPSLPPINQPSQAILRPSAPIFTTRSRRCSSTRRRTS